MYIQEIIIDGFKSYAQKTVVSGFDPQFNAITGLNGTGKSNILDAICFVLGISNLSQVRVGNLQELVYKQGQAGVTKASVTIIFNNADVAGSPVGYEGHKQITVTRQVVIGGKNKYIINGHTVQQSQVQNLFHSVQLNVNNPHFLIMQGRITKVLNMKPEETLSMIEEAAGTRMFETKKQAAQKTIEKKQLKVDEITKCMNDEITPTLENLRTERQDYHSWQSNNTEFERLERFCVAYEYKTALEKVESSENDKQALLDEQEELKTTIAEKNELAKNCSDRIAEIEQLRESEMEGEFQQLKQTETDISKELVKSNTLFTNQKESLNSESENLKNFSRQVETGKASLVEKNNELNKCVSLLETKEKEATAVEQNSIMLRERYQNACAGVADETSADLLSLPEQVATWEKREREAISQVKQSQQKSEHLKESLKELKKTSKAQSQAHSQSTKELDSLQNDIKTAENKMNQLKFTEADEQKLRTRSKELQVEVSSYKDQIDSLSASLEARLSFEFKNPEKGFDRSKVKGLVAKLVRVNDSKASTALEIAAGPKLYQVVVDTEQTGKLILQKGELKKRVTILPLNKINNRCVENEKVKKAKGLASSMGGSASLALELVGFEEEVRKAMEHVFGSTIICDNPEIAKAITFDKNIRTKTVTLDGDVYDPAGTLTGGSKNTLGVLLCKIEELGSIQDKFNEKDKELKAIVIELKNIEKEVNLSRTLAAELDLKRHALKICQDKMSDSSYAQTMNQITDMETQLETIEKDIVALKSQQEKAKQELSKLKLAENNNKKQRENALKEIESQMKNSQKQVGKLKSEVLEIKNKRDAIQAEIKAIAEEIATVQEQITTCQATVAKMTKECDLLQTKVTQLKIDYENAKKAVVAKNQELNKCSKEIKALESEKDKYLKESQNASLEARKLDHKIKQWEKDFQDSQKILIILIKQNSWIENEKDFFGQPGSDFDFAAKDVSNCQKRLKDLKVDQERLSKKINKKVMGMIENAESEYEELNRKKEVILNDKSKIEAVIEELDVKKSQALQSTWVKVNRDFGSIFSMLLPGTHAKLEPPEGKGVMDGLEVKVSFNGVWKESLTELSGGQRSLLALSLILSLLLFKPAPMYILDEVDAALDLSHTQNIGMMLRTHFSSSQFIVVSLKEGMFNNANVIFRTRFIDGVSAVIRTVAGSKNNKNITNTNAMMTEEDIEELESAPQKKKGKSSNKKSSGIENSAIF